jgi:hypothetical protein
MNRVHTSRFLAAGLLSGVAAIALAQTAPTTLMDVKLGLWEMTMTSRVGALDHWSW